MATSPTDDRTTELQGAYPTASLLVARPRLAYLYTELLKMEGSASTQDVVEKVDYSQSTVYNDMRELRETSLVSVQKTGRERHYRAKPFKFGVISEDDLTTITPTIVAVIGRQAVDRDVEQFVDEYGVEKLIEVVSYVIPYIDGRMTERIAARELGLSTMVATTIMIALEDTVREMKDVDEFFDDVRDAAKEGGPNRPREIRFADQVKVTFEKRGGNVSVETLNNLDANDMNDLREEAL